VAGPRTPFVAGNWKMFKGPSEAASFAAALAGRVEALAGVQVALCPPYVSLAATLAALDGSPVEVYAQNVHWAESGPFTGEISPPMLREVGVAGAVIGHSERRQHFGESDESVARRVGAALGAGLAVIACVGELESEREAGQTVHVLRRQVTAVAGALDGRDVSRLAIAYEPVWAIGTGKTATPAQAQEAHALIRGILDVRILYGGSVKPENAAELLAEPDVDGALVGGASLDVDTFVAICEAADRSRS
jgi:triosephosphate isomerase